ncbi:MAG: PEP-CTERM sorting domain-containing protein [Phycisphaerales bacterium]|nr:PEP-CTERM sorting domain-containing protein [Phycisphaerales bacterium]
MNIDARRSAVMAAMTLSLIAGSAAATLINFDDLGTSVHVTNQYAGLTFSSDPGEGIYTAGGTPVSYPNFICTAPIGGEIDCINNVYIDFATPVSGLSIWAIEANEFGTVATFYFYNGATLLGTQNLIGLASTPNTYGYGNQFIDLSAFSNVTRLEIRGPGGSGFIDNSYGGNGIGWDDLSYEDVPAPSAIGVLGLAGLAFSSRRRA